ncbi:MAG: 5-formyltetrahydrofolate cyclo-ligase [Rhabdochlamydiaceae bacterium]|nr:5-formyltetrahydrofolate cyclo-ligase [Candidatus Amphrikana amoebophyrae]
MNQDQSVNEEKKKIRQYFLAMREKMTMERRLEASLKCCAMLKQKVMNSEFVASFASNGKEINVWDLNITLCGIGKLTLPRVEDSHITFYHVKNIETDLVRSELGIMEPNPIKCQKVNFETVDAIIVPGLSFDLDNNRIGYGLGFYDKFLSHFKDKLKIGVCYSEQKAKKLPTLDHDIAVDIVLDF